MIAGLSVLQGISQAATGSLVAAVWQGVALAAAVGVGLRLLPKTPAAVRFAIWFAVFVVVAGLPVVSLWPHVSGSGGRGALLTLDSRWSVAVAGVWVLASLVRAGTLVVAGFRVRALWKRAEVVEVGEQLRVSPLPLRQAQGPVEMTVYASYLCDRLWLRVPVEMTILVSWGRVGGFGVDQC